MPGNAFVLCPACASPLPGPPEGAGGAPCPRCGDPGPRFRPALLRGTDFRERVLASPVPAIVDFFAGWCAPCRWLDPILEEVALEAGDQVRVVKVDVDEAPEWAERFGIRSVPTVILFVDGEERERSLGVEPHRIRRMAGIEGEAPPNPDRRT